MVDNWVDNCSGPRAHWREREAAVSELVTALQQRFALIRFLPAGAAAFVIAELFYKFHSFAAECLAFLVTWFVFDVAREWIGILIGRARTAAPSS